MKSLLLSAILFASLSAHAAGEQKRLVCTNHEVADGLHLEIAPDQLDATLSKKTAEGLSALQFGSLKCSKVEKENPQGADMMLTFLACRSPNVADAGYIVAVKAGGLWYHVDAEVSEESFVGIIHQETLFCQEQ